MTPIRPRKYNNLHRFTEDRMRLMIKLNNPRYLAAEDGDHEKLKADRVFHSVKLDVMIKNKTDQLTQSEAMRNLRAYLTDTGVFIGLQKEKRTCVDFDNVPDFVIEACFSKSRYSFIIVISFCIINGLDIKKFLLLTVVWINFDEKDWDTCVSLIKDMLNNKDKYFSYCYFKGRIETLDNKFMMLRGKRVEATHYKTFGVRQVREI